MIAQVHGQGAADVKIADVFANRAYLGIFRQFLANYAPATKEAQASLSL